MERVLLKFGCGVSRVPPAVANPQRFGSQLHLQLQPGPKSQALPERERNFRLMAADSNRSRLQPAAI